jgi:hypothetical protein
MIVTRKEVKACPAALVQKYFQDLTTTQAEVTLFLRSD